MSGDDEQHDESDLTSAGSSTEPTDDLSDDAVSDVDGPGTGAAADSSSGEELTDDAWASSRPDTDAGGVADGDTMYCTNCGASIDRNAEICPECGVRRAMAGGSSSGEKESGVSAVLSFLLPGVGQLYNGQVSRGAVVFIGWMVWEFVAFVITTLTLGIFFLIWVPVELFVHVVAAYDAYDQAEKINAGDVVVD